MEKELSQHQEELLKNLDETLETEIANYGNFERSGDFHHAAKEAILRCYEAGLTRKQVMALLTKYEQ